MEKSLNSSVVSLEPFLSAYSCGSRHVRKISAPCRGRELASPSLMKHGRPATALHSNVAGVINHGNLLSAYNLVSECGPAKSNLHPRIRKSSNFKIRNLGDVPCFSMDSPRPLPKRTKSAPSSFMTRDFPQTSTNDSVTLRSILNLCMADNSKKPLQIGTCVNLNNWIDDKETLSCEKEVGNPQRRICCSVCTNSPKKISEKISTACSSVCKHDSVLNASKSTERKLSKLSVVSLSLEDWNESASLSGETHYPLAEFSDKTHHLDVAVKYEALSTSTSASSLAEKRGESKSSSSYPKVATSERLTVDGRSGSEFNLLVHPPENAQISVLDPDIARSADETRNSSATSHVTECSILVNGERVDAFDQACSKVRSYSEERMTAFSESSLDISLETPLCRDSGNATGHLEANAYDASAAPVSPLSIRRLGSLSQKEIPRPTTANSNRSSASPLRRRRRTLTPEEQQERRRQKEALVDEEKRRLLLKQEEEQMAMREQAASKMKRAEEEKGLLLIEEDRLRIREAEMYARMDRDQAEMRKRREMRKADEAEAAMLEAELHRVEERLSQMGLETRRKELQRAESHETDEALTRKADVEQLALERGRRDDERAKEREQEWKRMDDEDRIMEEELRTKSMAELEVLELQRQERLEAIRAAEEKLAMLREEEQRRREITLLEMDRIEEERRVLALREQERLEQELEAKLAAERLAREAEAAALEDAQRARSQLLLRRQFNRELHQESSRTRRNQAVSQAFTYSYFVPVPRLVWELPIGWQKRRSKFSAVRKPDSK